MKYYYGNSYKEALGNDPVEIKTTKQLEQYKAVYDWVIPEDSVEEKRYLDIVSGLDLDSSDEDLWMDQLRSLESEGEITEEEYDYILDNIDELESKLEEN